MPTIVKAKDKNGNVYAHLDTSYWDKEKKAPRTKRQKSQVAREEHRLPRGVRAASKGKRES